MASQGTREHYSWGNHAKRYLRDLTDILEHASAPVLDDKTSRPAACRNSIA